MRATDSGLGCPDWPLCHGQLIPPLDDPKAWIEWIHRGIAVDHRVRDPRAGGPRHPRPSRPAARSSSGSLAAVGLVGFQAWLGRETVRLGNSGESVTAHLAAAMLLVGLLVFLTVRAGYPARIAGAWREPALHPAGGVRGGRDVRPAAVRLERDRDRRRARLPRLAADGRRARPGRSARSASAHILHRWVAAVVGVIVAIVAVVAWRTQRDHPAIVRLALVGGRPVRDPGRRRRPAGPDPAVGLDPDPAPGPRRGHLGAAGGAGRDQLLHRADGRRRRRRPIRPAARTTGLPAEPGAADPRRLGPRLHRADQAADHRAAARDHGPGHGPRDALGARHRLGGAGAGSWPGR